MSCGPASDCTNCAAQIKWVARENGACDAVRELGGLLWQSRKYKKSPSMALRSTTALLTHVSFRRGQRQGYFTQFSQRSIMQRRHPETSIQSTGRPKPRTSVGTSITLSNEDPMRQDGTDRVQGDNMGNQAQSSPHFNIFARGFLGPSTGSLKPQDSADGAPEEGKGDRTSSLPQSNVATRGSSAPSAASPPGRDESVEDCRFKVSDRHDQTTEVGESGRKASPIARDLAEIEDTNGYMLSRYLDQGVGEEPWCIRRSHRDEFVRDCEQVRRRFGRIFARRILLITCRRGPTHASAM